MDTGKVLKEYGRGVRCGVGHDEKITVAAEVECFMVIEQTNGHVLVFNSIRNTLTSYFSWITFYLHSVLTMV